MDFCDREAVIREIKGIRVVHGARIFDSTMSELKAVCLSDLGPILRGAGQ